MKEKTQLYIVPTPIGNLKDLTLRAIEVLKTVDIIACEDSRVTQKLLNHYDIKTKTISYHKFNEKERIKLFLNFISEDKTIALISDAGTPLICDPGAILVEELRNKGVKISALAGASALTTFLSQIPKGGEDFVFVGFLPKSESQILEILKKFQSTNIIFYESPNRLLKTLTKLQDFNPDLNIAVGRELTKVFEEIVINNVGKIIEYYQKNTLKGEIIAMIYRQNNDALSLNEIKEKINMLKKRNFTNKDISNILTDLYKLNKNDVYKLIIE